MSTNTTEPIDDDVEARILDAYRRAVKREGAIYQQPSSGPRMDAEGFVELENTHGTLATLRYDRTTDRVRFVCFGERAPEKDTRYMRKVAERRVAPKLIGGVQLSPELAGWLDWQGFDVDVMVHLLLDGTESPESLAGWLVEHVSDEPCEHTKKRAAELEQALRDVIGMRSAWDRARAKIGGAA